MKKKEIIKKSLEYTKIIEHGFKTKNAFFSIYYQKSAINHYGITIPKKTGNAVLRNKIKRQIKNIIDHYKLNIQNSHDYVIIVKKSILDISFQEMNNHLICLLEKIDGGRNEK